MLLCIFVITVLVAIAFTVQSQSQASDDELRWRVPLDKKVEIIQNDISERHLVEGTYVPAVPIPPGGGPVNHTTTGNTGDMHTSSWTGCYLVAQAFRYGWAKEHGTPQDIERALSLAGEALHGLDVLTHVSGKPGLLARQVFHGHGPGSEERSNSNSRNEWHQGVGEYINLRYREHPSHHNYHHVLRGLAMWYYFLQKDNPKPSPSEQAQLDKVRSIYAEMMEYGYKARDLALYTVDGRFSAHLLSGTREGEFSTRTLMATNCLRFAYWITGDSWFKDRYDELIERFGYRQAANWPQEMWQQKEPADQDDTEHVMASLWLVSRVEDDPELREFYRKAVAWLFDSKRKMKRSPFNYFYASALDDPQGADLPGALETLHLYPTVTLRLPLMNSIRTDLDAARNEAGVLPFNDQPLDNAYEWKGDPFRLDGYPAREITALAVSDEDPLVWYLADRSGTLYQSLDGGQSFAVCDFSQNGAVRDVTFAGNKSRIALVATDRGIFATYTGGYRNRWQLVLPGAARQVILDARNPNVAWAVVSDGIYRSVDFGMEQVGQAWECVSGPLPTKDDVTYGLATGPAAAMYAAIIGRLYRRGLSDSQWTMSPVDVEDYHFIPVYRQVAVSPDDPNTALLSLHLTVWGRSVPLVLRTRDGGKTLTIVGMTPQRVLIPSEGSGLEGADVTALTFAPDDPKTVYGASPTGVYRSTDGGTTWVQSNTGLRIPYAHRVFAPKQIPGRVFVTTPAGLHVSEDGGKTWSVPFLRLVGEGLELSELGGLGYLMAYWPGRHFGYVTEAQANASPDKW